MIEQGTIWNETGREREREFELERERERKGKETREKVSQARRRRSREEKGRQTALAESQRRCIRLSLFLSCFHLEAKHPELVRRRVELRVHRRLLLLLMEVLLVRVGEGRGRGLIFFSRSTKEMRRDTSEQRLVPNSSRWFPCFLSFVFELKELVTFVTQEAKKAGKARGKGCSEDSFFFSTLAPLQTAKLATLALDFFLLLLSSSEEHAPKPRRHCSRRRLH